VRTALSRCDALVIVGLEFDSPRRLRRSSPARYRRLRGSISWPPSGVARVSLYGGVDQLTGKEIRLRETERVAQKVQTRLLSQVGERRSPRTEATVYELLDRWLDVLDVEHRSRTSYVSSTEEQVRPTVGQFQVGP
jgi:hypothetical protein